jgi:DNA-binding MarR family transcriptional regulator
MTRRPEKKGLTIQVEYKRRVVKEWATRNRSKQGLGGREAIVSRYYTLTTDEANTLLALGARYGTLPELVVGTRLSPSEVKSTIDELESKELIVGEKDEQAFKLTDAGRSVRNELVHNVPYQSAHKPRRDGVRVLPPEATQAESDSTVESMDEEELDAAIESELAKLSE